MLPTTELDVPVLHLPLPDQAGYVLSRDAHERAVFRHHYAFLRLANLQRQIHFRVLSDRQGDSRPHLRFEAPFVGAHFVDPDVKGRHYVAA